MVKQVIIHDGIAIEYGRITRQEENQRQAYGILDFDIVRVPTVYGCFSSGGTDYLAMEAVNGQQWDAANKSSKSI
ncbi:hypothetical protein LTR17_024821, partial [Elasticomyces elasticus]